MRRVRFDERGAVESEAVVLAAATTAEQAMTDGPTVRAVVAYAEQLRDQAEKLMRADAFARPYYPTSASARRLSQRLGPEAALVRLRELALRHERRDRERDAESVVSLGRLRDRRANADSRRSRALAGMRPGERVDRALAELATISAAPAAGIGGDVVHGGEGDHEPRWPGDPSAKARRIALDAARAVEGELEAARRRDLEAAA
jgi:hypothetical protein